MNVLYAFNVSLMRRPYTDPAWDEWKTLLKKVHHQAESHPGFVARHHGENYPQGYIVPYPCTPLIMGNLSSWRSERELFDFTFTGAHRDMMLRRTEWFEPWRPDVRPLVMWWAPADKFDVREARKRLLHLQTKGSSDYAFGWSKKGGGR